ncbi:MAG: elongation factor G, partial [Acidobacteria bacterium]
MKSYPTEQIRNVALIGHSGAGKTIVAEAMLLTSGAIARLGKVEDGSTVCDHDPEETKKGVSVSMALAPIEWRGFKINVIDTPGSPDFEGDVAAALRVADLAVFVVSGVDGPQVQTRQYWKAASKLGIPRAVFVNKLDRERSSFRDTVTSLESALGRGFVPLQLPVGEEEAFEGLIDIAGGTGMAYSPGSPKGTTVSSPDL